MEEETDAAARAAAEARTPCGVCTDAAAKVSEGGGRCERGENG